MVLKFIITYEMWRTVFLVVYFRSPTFLPMMTKLNYDFKEWRKAWSTSGMCDVSFVFLRCNLDSACFFQWRLDIKGQIFLEFNWILVRDAFFKIPPVSFVHCRIHLPMLLIAKHFRYFRCITDHIPRALFCNLNWKLSGEKDAYIYESNFVPFTLCGQIPCRRNNLG